MRRAKRLPLAIAGSAIAALAVASAITGPTAVGLRGGGVAYGAQKPPAKKPVGAKRALAAMPLAFVRNEGQTDARVRFYAVGNHYAFFATPSELMLSLTREKPATQLALALRFIGHSTKVTTTAHARSRARSTTSAAPIRPSGRRSSRATATLSTPGSGRTSICTSTRPPEP